jgi:hypothetical protein
MVLNTRPWRGPGAEPLAYFPSVLTDQTNSQQKYGLPAKINMDMNPDSVYCFRINGVRREHPGQALH